MNKTQCDTIITLCQLYDQRGVQFRFIKDGMILTKVFQTDTVTPVKFSRLVPIVMLDNWKGDLESLVDMFCKEAERFYEKKTGMKNEKPLP